MFTNSCSLPVQEAKLVNIQRVNNAKTTLSGVRGSEVRAQEHLHKKSPETQSFSELPTILRSRHLSESRIRF